MVNIAFSGTREGMSKKQKDTFIERLHGIMLPFGLANTQEFHHGLSGLSDEFAHAIARACHFWVIGHPCDIEKYRFYCICDELRTMKPPLDRNQEMLDEIGRSGLLIATPLKDIKPSTRLGGTWSTVIRANKANIPFEIIQRNGEIRYEI